MSELLLLGHRGTRSRTTIPENTLASFDLALALGCDGFEFDVRLTKDGRAIICHDAKIRGVEVARAKEGQLTDLADLEAVLRAYSPRAFLDIELKVAGLESKVIVALAANPPQRGVIVSSFLPQVLNDLHLRTQNVPLGFIVEKRKLLPLWVELPVQSLIAHHSLIDRPLVESVHKRGKRLFAWTVNDRETMLRLAEFGVDAMISDDPELLAKVFGRNTSSGGKRSAALSSRVS